MFHELSVGMLNMNKTVFEIKTPQGVFKLNEHLLYLHQLFYALMGWFLASLRSLISLICGHDLGVATI